MQVRVSVEYYDGEPREALRLNDEQWGLLSYPEPNTEGSAADRLVKALKKEEAQNQLSLVKLGDVELKNTMQFKYLGVLQAVDGDSLASACRRVEISRSRSNYLKHILTASKLSSNLRLRLFQASVVFTLLYC